MVLSSLGRRSAFWSRRSCVLRARLLPASPDCSKQKFVRRIRCVLPACCLRVCAVGVFFVERRMRLPCASISSDVVPLILGIRTSSHAPEILLFFFSSSLRHDIRRTRAGCLGFRPRSVSVVPALCVCVVCCVSLVRPACGLSCLRLSPPFLSPLSHPRTLSDW